MNVVLCLDLQISINDFKNTENSTFSGKVLTVFVKEIGIPKTYEFNGSIRECVNVLLLDESGFLPAMVHNPVVMKTLRQGNYYRLYGTLTYDSDKKMLIINNQTSAARCKVETEFDQQTISAAPTLLELSEANSVTYAVSPIKDVFTSPRKRKMSVEGIVTKIYDTTEREVFGRKVRITNMQVRDSTTATNAGCFRELANKASNMLKVGDEIRLNDFVVSEHGGQQCLASLSQSTIEMLPKGTLKGIPTSFVEIEGDPLTASGTKIIIDGIVRTVAYPACPNEKCKFRRVQPLDTTPGFVKCTGCKATFASETLCETGLTAVFTIQTHVSNGDNKYTIFTDSVKTLLKLPKQLPFGCISSFELEDKIFEKLPISCTGKIRVGDNSIIDILSVEESELTSSVTASSYASTRCNLNLEDIEKEKFY